MERLKGLTIELDLDTLKVNSGLTDLRSKLRLVNSEMRSNMSAFDRSDRTIGKYETRLSGLNKKLEVQKAVTESARKNYEKMVKEHGEGSIEADKAAAAFNRESAQLQNLERYIGRTNEELRNLQREQAETSSKFYKTGDAILNFSNGLEGISDKVKSVGSDLTKYLTVPIAGLVTTVGGMGFKRAMAIEQVEMMMEHISDDAAQYENRMKNVVDLVTDTRFGTAELGAEYAKFIGASASDESANLYSKVAMNLSAFKMDDALIPQIGDLFTKSLQSGKIDGTMINQFTNAGVDILKTLGNVWGVGQEEVRERLREGNFNIEEVLGELSVGILNGTKGIAGETKAMGGMLEKSGDTLSGQIKNFFAAISLSGERLIKETGLFDGVKEAFAELRNMLKSGELDSVLLPTFQGLAKALEALVEMSRKLFKWYSSLDDSTKGLIGKFVGFAAVIGPILVGIGTFGGLIAKALKPIGTFFKWIAKSKALKMFGTVAAEGGKKVGLLSRAFAFLTGPIGIAIGIITLLATGFTIAYKKSDTFRNFVHGLGEKLKEVFLGIAGYVKPGIDAVVGFFDEIKEKITGFKNNEGGQILEAFQNIGTGIFKALEFIGKAFTPVIEGIKLFVEFMKPITEGMIATAWAGLQDIITGSLDVIMGAVKIFSGIFTGDFDKIWEGIKQIFSGAIDIIWGVFQTSFIGQLIGGIIEFASGFKENINDMWESGKGWFSEGANFISDIWESIKTIAADSWEIIKNVILGPILLLINLVTGDMEGFKKNLSSIWRNISEASGRIVGEMKKVVFETISNLVIDLISKAGNLKDDFVTVVAKMITDTIKKFIDFKSDAQEKFNDVKDTIINTIKDIDLKQIGKDIVQGLIDGIKSKVSAVGDAVKGVASSVSSKIKTALKIQSPSKVTTEDGEFVGDGLVVGILSRIKSVGRAATKLAHAAMPDIPTQSMKQLAVYGKSTNSEVPHVGGNADINFYNAITEQNEYLKEMVDLLMRLLDKDFEAVLAFEPVFSAVKQRMNEDNYSRYKQKRGGNR